MTLTAEGRPAREPTARGGPAAPRQGLRSAPALGAAGGSATPAPLEWLTFSEITPEPAHRSTPLLTGRRGGRMEALRAAATLVHYYDTRAHTILCGLWGSDHRSTKHSRSVTCSACVGLLRERPRLALPEESVAMVGDVPA